MGYKYQYQKLQANFTVQQQYQTQHTKYNAMANNHKQKFKQTTTTHNNDSVYFVIISNIDIYKSKQSKIAITYVNKSNREIFTVIGALVIDIHQQTQTGKTLFDHFF